MDENNFEEFVIDNDSKAEWALKKIKEARDEHDRLQALIDEEYEILAAKQANIDNALEHETSFLKHQLNNYMESVACKSTKTQKTYQLLTGKLVHKYGGLDYIRDEQALVEWCRNNRPLLLKVEPKVDWATLKKELIVDEDGGICTQDGEILECIRAEKKPDSFDIKF